MGGLVYTWPKLCGRELWSFKLGNWSFWLITAGISTMGLVLTAGGLQQGFMWMTATEWLESLVPVSPSWFIRTLAGIPMEDRQGVVSGQSVSVRLDLGGCRVIK